MGGITLHEKVGQSFTASVGTFVTIAPATNLQASIAWGDGSSSAGTLKAIGPIGVDQIEFQVTDTHTYLAKGTFGITVTVIQPAPTPTSPVRLVATIKSSAVVTAVSTLTLGGSVSGKYSLAPTAASVGATYVLSGTGAVTPLGAVSAQGIVTLPPLGTTGHATGTLTLSVIGTTPAASGTIALALTGLILEPSSGGFPAAFSYTITGGTGIYAGATGTGGIGATLGTGNTFTFNFLAVLPPVPA